MKIGDLSDETGVSRELIHHYLRQGLLPRSPSRGLYTAQQRKLLGHIKSLRDDHHLPLEVIRGVFEFFSYDAERIDALTQADSLSRRMSRLAAGGEVLSSRILTAEELQKEAGITAERLAEYREARLVHPVAADGQARYSSYDAKVISLCELGARIGLPFESLRTIGSYVRVGFELEHPMLLDTTTAAEQSPQRAVGEVVARLEVVTSFIQSLLQSLISHQVRDLHVPGPRRRSLDGVVYRPSAGFLRRHRIDARQEAAQQRICDAPAEPAGWIDVARALLHAGSYNEAVFFLEQALERWPADPELRSLYGRGLLLSGRLRRAARELAEPADDPRCAVYRVLIGFAAAGGDEPPDPGLPNPAASVHLIEDALGRLTELPPADRFETRLLAGWLLTALPRVFRQPARGRELLARTLSDLEAVDAATLGLPGLRDRLRINAAYLLFDALERAGVPARAAAPPPEPTGPADPREALRTLICRLDPGCAFAETVYLSGSDRAEEETP